MAIVERIERLERNICVKEGVATVSDNGNDVVFMKLPNGARVIDVIANVEEAFTSADGQNPPTANVKLGNTVLLNITDTSSTGTARASAVPTIVNGTQGISIGIANSTNTGKIRVVVIYAKPSGVYYDVQ